MKFSVIDPNTSRYPDLRSIAFREYWAKGVAHHKLDGFAIDEDGQLLLLDKFGGYVYCPVGRFQVATEKECKA